MRHSDSLLITKLYCVQHAAAAPLLSPPWPVLLLNVRSAGHMAEWTGTSAGGGRPRIAVSYNQEPHVAAVMLLSVAVIKAR
jgi:hypothetical protein